jgi:hypothetical protein
MKHSLDIRLDILNVGNMINKQWGLSPKFVNLQPLSVPSTAQGGPANAQGQAQFLMRVVNGALMDHTFDKNAALLTGDVYLLQLGIKYYFN